MVRSVEKLEPTSPERIQNQLFLSHCWPNKTLLGTGFSEFVTPGKRDRVTYTDTQGSADVGVFVWGSMHVLRARSALPRAKCDSGCWLGIPNLKG